MSCRIQFGKCYYSYLTPRQKVYIVLLKERNMLVAGTPFCLKVCVGVGVGVLLLSTRIMGDFVFFLPIYIFYFLK